MAETWPYGLFPSSMAWWKSGASRTGGRSLTGRQQVVRSDAGFWQSRMTLHLGNSRRRGENRTLAYRGLMASLDGMAGEVLVPCTLPFRPYDMNGRMLNAATMVGVGEDALFSHVGWGIEETPIMFADAASRGATRMTIRHPHVQGLRPGHYFGIGERLYLVSNTWQLDYEWAESTGGDLTFGGEALTFGVDPLGFGVDTVALQGENVEIIEFWPRLRETHLVGTPLILGAPVCKMRLASDETGVLDQGVSDYGTVTLEFEESY